MLHLKNLNSLQRSALSAAVLGCLLACSSAAQASYTFSYTANVYTNNDTNPLIGNSGTNSFTGINTSNTIAGTYTPDFVSTYSYVNKARVVYGASPNGTNVTKVTGINNSGAIVGTYYATAAQATGTNTSAFYSTASAYGASTPSQTIVDSVNHGSAVTSTLATGVSDTGIVVGYETLANGSVYNFEYNSTTKALTEINTTATGFDASGNLQFNAISSDGKWIAGTFWDSNSLERSFVYNTSTNTWKALADLGIYGGAATGVNKNGEVVGWYNNETGTYGYTYDANTGTYTDTQITDPLSGNNTQILGVNDNGVIAGVGGGYYGFTASYVNTPSAVPVPGAVWLMSSALAGFGFLRRRKA
jgi:hypothetical protein